MAKINNLAISGRGGGPDPLSPPPSGSAHATDLRLGFRYTDNTIRPLLFFIFFQIRNFYLLAFLLRPYSPLCVKPVRNPICWFPQAQAPVIHPAIIKA